MAKPQKKVKKQVKSRPTAPKADEPRGVDPMANRGPRNYANEKSINRGINAPSAKAPRRAH